jgi:hypothetical protein
MYSLIRAPQAVANRLKLQADLVSIGWSCSQILLEEEKLEHRHLL